MSSSSNSLKRTAATAGVTAAATAGTPHVSKKREIDEDCLPTIHEVYHSAAINAFASATLIELHSLGTDCVEDVEFDDMMGVVERVMAQLKCELISTDIDSFAKEMQNGLQELHTDMVGDITTFDLIEVVEDVVEELKCTLDIQPWENITTTETGYAQIIDSMRTAVTKSCYLHSSIAEFLSSNRKRLTELGRDEGGDVSLQIALEINFFAAGALKKGDRAPKAFLEEYAERIWDALHSKRPCEYETQYDCWYDELEEWMDSYGAGAEEHGCQLVEDLLISTFDPLPPKKSPTKLAETEDDDVVLVE